MYICSSIGCLPLQYISHLYCIRVIYSFHLIRGKRSHTHIQTHRHRHTDTHRRRHRHRHRYRHTNTHRHTDTHRRTDTDTDTDTDIQTHTDTDTHTHNSLRVIWLQTLSHLQLSRIQICPNAQKYIFNKCMVFSYHSIPYHNITTVIR